MGAARTTLSTKYFFLNCCTRTWRKHKS